jgi:hypothetical protein
MSSQVESAAQEEGNSDPEETLMSDDMVDAEPDKSA